MKLSSPFLCLLLAKLALTTSPRVRSQRSRSFNEQLQAQGLLGAHFGHVDIAAAYDYVVVGGGTAGLTIARRLAESHTVAVIEAGSFYELDNGNFTEIPADASNYLGKHPLLANPLVDWRQMTTPQPGFDGASILYPQGHTLGGSSARNIMWYQRGSKGSYQKWADLVGDQSFSFTNFLPYFKKSVQFSPLMDGERAANATPLYQKSWFSNTGGPLQVSWPKFASPSASWVTLGLNAIGLKELPGAMHDGNLLGWTWVSQTINPDLQTRSSSESSMLREALILNDNLIVFRSTLGKKVLFNENKLATGVQVESTGVGSGSITYTLNATKEVIISSGAFRSPQLLMVSGIGPAETLQENGIEVIADRPGVGQGMWDHVFFGPSRVVDTVTHNFLGDAAFSAAATEEYIRSRTGILTNVGGDLLGTSGTLASVVITVVDFVNDPN